MSREEREHWEAKHAGRPGTTSPAPFLVQHVDLLAPGLTLDVAAGTGRNALFLARRGHRVVAMDVARAGLERIREADRTRAIACVQMDSDAPGIRTGSLDNVIVVSFLDRRLFDEAARWLRPGGVLLWDTFLLGHREIGTPRNVEFLLRQGELVGRLAGRFEVLAWREGLTEEPAGPAFRSGIVARARAQWPQPKPCTNTR